MNSVSQPENLKIKILKGIICQDDNLKPFIEYICEISFNLQVWRINRRFNQFVSLHRALSKNFPTLLFPESSSIFFVSEMSGNFHDVKIKAMEKYIKELSKIEYVINCPYFRKFIGFDSHFDNSVENNQEIFDETFKSSTVCYSKNQNNQKIIEFKQSNLREKEIDFIESNKQSDNNEIFSKQKERINNSMIEENIKEHLEEIEFNSNTNFDFNKKMKESNSGEDIKKIENFDWNVNQNVVNKPIENNKTFHKSFTKPIQFNPVNLNNNVSSSIKGTLISLNSNNCINNNENYNNNCNNYNNQNNTLNVIRNPNAKINNEKSEYSAILNSHNNNRPFPNYLINNQMNNNSIYVSHVKTNDPNAIVDKLNVKKKPVKKNTSK